MLPKNTHLWSWVTGTVVGPGAEFGTWNMPSNWLWSTGLSACAALLGSPHVGIARDATNLITNFGPVTSVPINILCVALAIFWMSLVKVNALDLIALVFFALSPLGQR